MSASIRDLRDDHDADQTLQNLLRALTLHLELRSRYRVFEFEAKQDGQLDVADLFQGLRRSGNAQIAELIAGLQRRLSQSTEAVGEQFR